MDGQMADQRPSPQAARPRPPPNRRRDKPQLSCNTCRRRKLKCDRQQPCSNCTKNSVAAQCVFAEQFPSQQHAASHASTPSSSHGATPISAPASTPSRGAELPAAEVTRPPQETSIRANEGGCSAHGSERLIAPRAAVDPSSSTSPAGTLNLNSQGPGYRDPSHWTSLLKGIPEMREQPASQEEVGAAAAAAAGTARTLPTMCPGILLQQGCEPTTTREAIAALPPRRVADRLVAYYFTSLEYSIRVVHTHEFMRHYIQFWEDPESASASWLALLFSMCCLATQFQNPKIRISKQPQARAPQHDPEIVATIERYRTKVVQCLVLSNYSRGGPHILETIANYVVMEQYLRQDSDIGTWLVVGNLMQIATLMGLHRDPAHFKSLSPFEGEMRRRVWATMFMMELSCSTQMGMPRIIKDSIVDTLEPRNLQDDDIYPEMVSLPPERPWTELTPALMVVAKSRMSKAFSVVSDLVTDPRPHSYKTVMEIDAMLGQTMDDIPPPCRHRPMSKSIMDSPKLITQRIHIELVYFRAKILLHRKYLTPETSNSSPDPADNRGRYSSSNNSGASAHAHAHAHAYTYSRNACVSSAMGTLEHQHVLDDELQLGGRLESIRWVMSSMVNHEFLLATSVLCFCVRNMDLDTSIAHAAHRGPGPRAETGTLLGDIQSLLRRTRRIWSRSGGASAEAHKAAEALRVVLGDDPGEGAPGSGPGTAAEAAGGIAAADMSRPVFPATSDVPMGNSLAMQQQQQQDALDNFQTPFSFFNFMLDDLNMVAYDANDPESVFSSSQMTPYQV